MKGESADRTLASLSTKKNEAFNMLCLTPRFWQACQGQQGPRWFHGYNGDSAVGWTSEFALTLGPTLQCDRPGYTREISCETRRFR